MSKVETSYGHVLSVQSRILGSALDGDQVAGTVVLVIQDCSDFDDEFGGTCTLNGTTYTFSAVDDDASTITLSPPLAADASDGDEVQILDPVLGSPEYEALAAVTEDGEDPGEPIEATIDSGVLEQLPEGIRGLAGEPVRLRWDEFGQVSVASLVSVRDDMPGVVQFMQDYATATGNTAVTIHLTYQPVPDSSVKVSWGGVGLDRSEWDFVDPWTITVPAQGFHAGDVFEAHYAWTDPTPRPVTPATLLFVAATTPALNTQTSLALPTGTEPGDLLVLAMETGGFGNNPTCSDSRISVQYADNHVFVGYGFADSSTSDITVDCSDGENNGGIVLSAYRVTGTITAVHSSGTTPMAPTMPAGTPEVGIMALAYGSTEALPSPQAGWVLDANRSGGGSPGGVAETWSCQTGTPSFSFASTVGWSALILGMKGD